MTDFRSLFDAPKELREASDDRIAHVAIPHNKPRLPREQMEVARQNLTCHMYRAMGIKVKKTGMVWVKTKDWPDGLFILWGVG